MSYPARFLKPVPVICGNNDPAGPDHLYEKAGGNAFRRSDCPHQRSYGVISGGFKLRHIE
jgi:hypothetical protein